MSDGFPAQLADLARLTPGFMPEAEGLALYEAGRDAGGRGPMLEIGGYCGLSALYLGSAAAASGRVLFSVDHHRGSEENQPGQPYHDGAVVDALEPGRIDTLPHFRRTVARAGLEATVVAVVGESAVVARWWGTPLALVFIDGGHSAAAVNADYTGWGPWVAPGGLLAIHDVFPDPAVGGQAPYHVYRRALLDGFVESAVEGSLRVLRKARA